MSVQFSSAILSAVHVIGIAISLGAIAIRAHALGGVPDMKRATNADNWWGISALLVISTGLIRLMGPYAKGMAFYMAQPMFMAKMGLFGTVLLLELWPMVTLMRWRIDEYRGREPDLSPAPWISRISYLQTGLVVLLPFTAALMARGWQP